jgi:hypothetical protein
MTTVQFGYTKPSKTSVFKAALIGIPIGLLLFALWHFQVEPAYTLISPIVTFFAGLASGFVLWIQNQLPQVSDYINQKPEVIATVGMGAITLIGVPLIKNYFSNKAANAEVQAKQAESLAINANTELQKAKNQIQNLETQLENTKPKPTDFTKEEDLIEAQEIIGQQSDQIKNLQGQLQGLQTQLLLEKTKTVTVKEVH